MCVCVLVQIISNEKQKCTDAHKKSQADILKPNT